MSEAVATQALGLVHRTVGVVDELGRGQAIPGPEGDTDAGRDVGDLAIEIKGLLQLLEQLVSDALDDGQIFEVGQDDRKLVTAQPRHRVGLAHAFT